MNGNNQPIGFFDSGVGGISVLIEAVRGLPHESFVYWGDSLNAPYGVKTVNEVQALTIKSVEALVDKGVKAIVIACNTATSASIELLRERFHVQIIGMEPALKLAVDTHIQGAIAVLATPMTLKERKFEQLMARVGLSHEIIRIPAPALVLAVESNNVSEDALFALFDQYFESYAQGSIDSIVLGCTHFIFVKEALIRYFKGSIRIVDGNQGTIRHLEKTLMDLQALSSSEDKGAVEIMMTGGATSQRIAEEFLRSGLTQKEG